MIRACHGCRDWSKCRGYEYYYPSEIRWCWHQVMFMVRAREAILGTGCDDWLSRPNQHPPADVFGGYRWPTEPSGYVGEGGRPQPSSHAPFEGVVEVAVVLEQRWGKLQGHSDIKALDKQLAEGRTYGGLSFKARSVVLYLLKHRSIVYSEWCKNSRHNEERD